MGNTKIIELNHDLSHEIKENPEEFIQQILLQLSCFNSTSTHYMSNGETFVDNRILGGRVIAGFHRSGFIEETWLKCKMMMSEALKGRNNH